MIPLHALGSPFAGFVFDRTASYDLAFRTFVGMFALSMVVLRLLRLPAVGPGQAEAEPAPARAA